MWVFGYGSLLWNPGFDPVESSLATLNGFRRSFCMWSIHHRGTEDDPGLVLALDEADHHCEGLALRAADAEVDSVLAMLRERELISSAYFETWQDVTLADGRVEKAVTYVINPDHRQYCGGLSLEKQASIIASAQGLRGPNVDYLYNTAEKLRSLGIADAEMDELETHVRELA